jgi:hypothetical protein
MRDLGFMRIRSVRSLKALAAALAGGQLDLARWERRVFSLVTSAHDFAASQDAGRTESSVAFGQTSPVFRCRRSERHYRLSKMVAAAGHAIGGLGSMPDGMAELLARRLLDLEKTFNEEREAVRCPD